MVSTDLPPQEEAWPHLVRRSEVCLAVSAKSTNAPHVASMLREMESLMAEVVQYHQADSAELEAAVLRCDASVCRMDILTE